jgi:hypothetical protein
VILDYLLNNFDCDYSGDGDCVKKDNQHENSTSNIAAERGVSSQLQNESEPTPNPKPQIILTLSICSEGQPLDGAQGNSLEASPPQLPIPQPTAMIS